MEAYGCQLQVCMHEERWKTDWMQICTEKNIPWTGITTGERGHPQEIRRAEEEMLFPNLPNLKKYLAHLLKMEIQETRPKPGKS